jgi:PAS domain S-box-containing protein
MCPVVFEKIFQRSKKGVAYCRKQSGYKITDADPGFVEMTGLKTGDSIGIDQTRGKYYSDLHKRSYDIEIIEMSKENCVLILTQVDFGEDHDGQKYRFIVENIHDIIYSIDPNGVFDFVSSAWKNMLGHEPKSVEGTSFQVYVHPDDISICSDFLNHVLTTKQRQSGVEYRVKHASGSWRWHTSSAVPVFDEKGEAAGYIGVASDITDKIIRRQREQR